MGIRIRDVDMASLGYRLEDRPGAASAWKPDDPAVLRREAAERQRAKLASQRKKLEQTLKLKQTVSHANIVFCRVPCAGEQLLPVRPASGCTNVGLLYQELDKLRKLESKPPLEKELAEKFQPGSWDAEGFPTADKDGNPLSEKVLATPLPV